MFNPPERLPIDRTTTNFRTRVAKAREARDPDGLPNITNRIPDGIESTEGDGFVDLA